MADPTDSTRAAFNRPAALTDGARAPMLGQGAMLGGYRIQSLIAVGGMATVYRALDELCPGASRSHNRDLC